MRHARIRMEKICRQLSHPSRDLSHHNDVSRPPSCPTTHLLSEIKVWRDTKTTARSVPLESGTDAKEKRTHRDCGHLSDIRIPWRLLVGLAVDISRKK